MRATDKSEVPRIRALLDSAMARAIDDEDAATLRSLIEGHQTALPLVQTWLEALGARLEIRDFLIGQRDGLTDLGSSSGGFIGERIRSFLQHLDQSLGNLVGLPDHGGVLRSRRLERLRKEPDDSLLLLAGEFTKQSSDSSVLFPDRLIRHTREVRDNIVEQLWPVDSTLRESGEQAAQQELSAAITRLRTDISDHIQNVTRLQ